MRLTARIETWPITGTFRIARGAKSEAEVILVELEEDGILGRGECVPYARYGETVAGVLATVRSFGDNASTIDHAGLGKTISPGAARNALDCALWDFVAKRRKTPAWRCAGLPEPQPIMTSFTISLDTPEAMGKAAQNAKDWPILKIKLNQEQFWERLAAVQESAPQADIVIDANESWTPRHLENVLSQTPAGVVLIEQPLPADNDDVLASLNSPIRLCADESVHDTHSLAELIGKYQTVNIKLDKSGGLTEAISMARKASSMGFEVMVGCMVGTSLAMAPALMLSSFATFVDLDGPLLLSRDRLPSLRYADGMVFPPTGDLWG